MTAEIDDRLIESGRLAEIVRYFVSERNAQFPVNFEEAITHFRDGSPIASHCAVPFWLPMIFE